MLSTRSFVNPPLPIEKTVSVKILRPIRVAGKVCEVGATATMSLSDAQALVRSVPPKIEIL